MKKNITILTILLLCLSLTYSATYLSNKNKIYATNKVVTLSPIKITTKVINEANDYIEAKIKVPTIDWLEDAEIQRKTNESFLNKAMSFKDETCKIAIEGKKDATKNGFPFNKYEVYIDYKVACNKNNLLSIPVTYYNYTGGAHGFTYITPNNINLKTGKNFALKDMFKSNYDYMKIINATIIEEITKEAGNYFPDAIKTIENAKEDPSFYIQNGNIVVYYGLYEIAPYASGIIEFKIPYSLFDNQIKPEYMCERASRK